MPIKKRDISIGIKKAYPHIPLPLKIRSYVQLVRPFTLIAPTLAVLFGVWACLKWTGQGGLFLQEWKTVIYAAVAMAAAQACGQVINQARDIDLDIANGKGYRPVPRGLVTPEEAMGLGWILGIFAIVRGFMISPTFGGLMSALIFFAVFYNIEPIRAKMRLWINVAWLGVSRGLLPMLAVWTIFGSLTDPYPWAMGSVLLVWVTGFQCTKDVPDVVGDRKYGVPTIPVRYGINGTVKFMGACMVIAMVLFYAYLGTGILPKAFVWVGLLWVPSGMILLGLGERHVLVAMENTAEWCLFYGCLAAWYVMPPFLM